MSRTTASTAVILALLTGLVLGQLGSLATQPGAFRSGAPSTAPRSMETARSFYDAMSHLLATGDRVLDASLAPGFTEHGPDGQTNRTLPEMIDGLVALRSTWPNLQLTVVSLDQHESMTVARLQIDPGKPRAIPGLPLPAVEPMVVTEHLRIDRSGITDRWSANLGLPMATTMLQTELSWKPPSLSMPAIMRIAIEPGRAAPVPLDGPAILRAETGTVQLSQASNDFSGNGHSSIDPMLPGEMRLLETSEVIEVRNIGDEPAELWVFTGNIGSVSQAPATVSSEPPVIKLFGFIPLTAANSSNTTQRISIARVTLPPGTDIATHRTGIMEAIAIVDGELDVTVSHGQAVFCTDGASAHLFDGTDTFSAGSGISAKGPTTLSYRVAGSRPVTLFVMRIDP